MLITFPQIQALESLSPVPGPALVLGSREVESLEEDHQILEVALQQAVPLFLQNQEVVLLGILQAGNQNLQVVRVLLRQRPDRPVQ